MKKLVLLTKMTLIGCVLQAQITMSAQLPAGGVMVKDQLWNVVITNAGANAVILRLQVDVRDLLAGQSVLNAGSGRFTVGQGLKVITVRDVQPVTYNYAVIGLSNTYLPCGNYMVNYQLIQETDKGDVPVANEITRLNVAPLSPPLLSEPANQATVESTYPQFVWTPPMPIQMFNNVNYEIRVTKVEENQNPQESIEFNNPVYSNYNLATNSEKMPASFTALVKGYTYAWRIVAKSDEACILPSEVWTFTVGKDSVAKIIEGAPYVKISRSNTEVTIVHQGVIKMEYMNPGADKMAAFIIYNAADKDGKNDPVAEFEVPLKEGQNFLQYDLNKKLRLDEKTVYEVLLVNGRKEEWRMRFTSVYYHK